MSDNKNSSNTSKGGLSFASVLTLVFIVLKLCGVISWSWIWVLCPLWIGVALVILIVIIAFIVGIINNS